MKIACVQQAAHPVWAYREALKDMTEQIDAAARAGAELILLPECAYPAYFLELDREACAAALAETERVLETVSGRAKSFGVYVALGIALPENGRLYNAAILFDDRGKVCHRSYKSNLWHFDGRSFTPGEIFQTVDTKFGRIGMMVCADGRIPEIARILAKQGAKLILDLVNLVASARRPTDLMNQQYAFMLPVRAMENGVWLAAADKCGTEGGSAVYLGRSMVISPTGEIVAECPPDRPDLLLYDIDLSAATGPGAYRLPGSCGILCAPTEELPIYRKTRGSHGPVAAGERLVASVQFRSSSLSEYVEKAGFYLRAAQRSWCRVVALPLYDGEGEVERLCALLRPAMEEEVVVFTGCLERGKARAAAMTRQETALFWSAGEGPVVQEIDGLGYCVLLDEQPYLPELPRTALLQGCEVLIWMDRSARTMDTKVAQTRATENKMFIVRTSCAPEDASYVVNPGGVVAATTIQGAEQLASALVLQADGLSKTVFPGTDIIKSRIPAAYKELLQ